VLWMCSTRGSGGSIFHEHWMTGLVLMDVSFVLLHELFRYFHCLDLMPQQ
jgi:hypothetical protein